MTDFLLSTSPPAGLGNSSYIREVALGNISQNETDFSKYDNAEALQNLHKELLKIGNNINQMGRVANTVGDINGD